MIEFLQNGWQEHLKKELSLPYFMRLEEFIRSEYHSQIVYPKQENIFSALNLVKFEDVKVVILGQDPYHNPNQANGLSFSVMDGIKLPPSLRNIFKELQLDLNLDFPISGDLTAWANQGVLLLNAILTVRKNAAGSHQKKGWETFTNAIIQKLSNERKHLIFLLWGSYAQKKGDIIDEKTHLLLRASHPSPFSSYRGFFGCKHFSQTNQYLLQNNQKPIDWNLSDKRQKMLDFS